LEEYQGQYPEVVKSRVRPPEEAAASDRRWKRFWFVVAVVGSGLLVALLLPV
jgi:hypothetical protein